MESRHRKWSASGATIPRSSSLCLQMVNKRGKFKGADFQSYIKLAAPYHINRLDINTIFSRVRIREDTHTCMLKIYGFGLFIYL